MSEPRRFQITFRPPYTEPTQVGSDRSTYELALDFTARVHTVVELAELERFHLRDALDRKATALAVALSKSTNMPLVQDRRFACRATLPAAQDCAAMLDIIAARGTVPPEVIEPARAVIKTLINRIEDLAN